MNASLEVANHVEAQVGWEVVGTSPGELAAWIQRIFTVPLPDGGASDDYILGSTEPTGDTAKNKIWINTGAVPFIQIPQNGGSSFSRIYPYPPYVPLLWTRTTEEKPSYLRQLSPIELTKFGLTNPYQTEYYYVIFEP